jgi:DNA-binding winged helix-turn-helix (wHTH) protein/tetratricopeptide (TPR) repeat protein
MDLAHQPVLQLGKLEVRPSTREVVHPGGREIVEPRVMAVLVVLADANGRVVTRDELTEACWEGRVVSDDAINRVISRIRKIADLTSGRDFTLETITKIGYRLLTAEPGTTGRLPGSVLQGDATHPGPATASPPRAIPRRTLIAAGVAAIAGAGGAVIWRLTQPAGPPDRAVELYRRAIEIGPTDEAKDTAQSISFLREAVDLSPDYAEAWAALALAYSYSFATTPPEKHALLADRARDAANRALAIQPGNADALAALTLLLTPYQHWQETEAAYREALARKPRLAPLDCVLGDLLVSTGRVTESVPHAERAVAQTPLIARRHYELAIAYWYAGRLDDADRVINKAAGLWPLDISLWFGRLYQQMYGGNLPGAIAMLADQANRPPGIPDSDFALVETVANALQSNKPADRARAIAANLAAAPDGLGYARNAVIFSAALGDFDAAVTAADAYYFDRPFPVAPTYFTRAQGEYLGVRSRETAFLFSPPLAAFRADNRFEKIVAEIGLETYWRTANVMPDYRRPTNR